MRQADVERVIGDRADVEDPVARAVAILSSAYGVHPFQRLGCDGSFRKLEILDCGERREYADDRHGDYKLHKRKACV